MAKLTVQIFLDRQWRDAAEIDFAAPERGHLSATRLDYVAPYVVEQLNNEQIAGAVVGSRYPVDFSSHSEPHWPAFLLDLLPGGEGRRRWAERLKIPNDLRAEFKLLEHAAANPAGNLRIKEAAQVRTSPSQSYDLPDSAGQLVRQDQHPGFSCNDIVSKQEHFIEYAYNLGAAVAGATDVQGEAPKFLMAEDVLGRWHAEGAIADVQVKKRWIVKFPRGKSNADRKIIHNEAKYLEVARRFGVDVGEPLRLEKDALFIPRFDRCQRNGKTERIAMESLYSVAGIAGFGLPCSHELLCEALMELILPEERLQAALEYIKRDLLNVVMGNTDNHGRNTAILRDRNGRVQLSPLFDFAPMYLDPEGIARVTRWQGSREQGGRPNWLEVVSFFEPWLDVKALRPFVAELERNVMDVRKTMLLENVDSDIISNRQYAIENQLVLLRQCHHA